MDKAVNTRRDTISNSSRDINSSSIIFNNHLIMKNTLTAKQINKKYAGRYVDVGKTYDYETDQFVYEVRKTYKDIHENTTLGEDLETANEYKR